MDEPLVVTDLQRAFGETKALQGVTFTLRKGEWLALLGPNGAGKTTAVRTIAGRVRPDAGTVTLLGSSLNEADATVTNAARARLGIVPQDIALYPYLTARENLLAFARLNGLDAAGARERADWALAWTGLDARSGDRVRTFSGGMKRRLNLACGVLHQPEVILLDEPTVGVDPQSRERIWDMLSQLRDDGASLLLTTHQLDEAQHVCDRIVIVDGGRVIADGTLEELIEQTVGAARRVTIRLDAPASPGAYGEDVSINDDSIEMSSTEIAADLPRLLARVSESGRRVEHLQVAEPSLQAVFLHLTGRELRE